MKAHHHRETGEPALGKLVLPHEAQAPSDEDAGLERIVRPIGHQRRDTA
jgi:hypothetical protein